MKDIIKYGYLTLMVVQILFVLLWYLNLNILGILYWIGQGDNYHSLRLFLPLIIYASVKVLYWFADPLSELFEILIRWAMIIGVFYLFYWIFLT
jgi:hypothetical protein